MSKTVGVSRVKRPGRPGGRPIAAPLEWPAELLGVDLATVRELATKVEPYVRADGTRSWSLMLCEWAAPTRGVRPAPGWLLDRRRTRPPAAQPRVYSESLTRAW